jgi:hypothetical protein
MLRHKLEILPECDIEHTVDFAYKKCAEIFKGVKHVFILLDHYHEFAGGSFFHTRFGLLGRGHESGNIKVEHTALRNRALDPTIISLLKAHIESTTTPGSIYRIRCEIAVTRLFPSYGTVQKAEDYDTEYMLEAAAREEASSVSQEGLLSSTLECQPNKAASVSVEPPQREYRGRSRDNIHVVEWPSLSANKDTRQQRAKQRDKNKQAEEERRRWGGSRKKNKHNTTKKYKTKTRKSRQTRRNKHKHNHARTIKRRKSRRNNSN